MNYETQRIKDSYELGDDMTTTLNAKVLDVSQPLPDQDVVILRGYSNDTHDVEVICIEATLALEKNVGEYDKIWAIAGEHDECGLALRSDNDVDTFIGALDDAGYTYSIL